MKKRYLTRKDIALEYGISISTLAHWPRDGRGPPYSRPGRAAQYAREDVDAFFAACRVDLQERATANMPKRPIGRPRKLRQRSLARRIVASSSMDQVVHGSGADRSTKPTLAAKRRRRAER